MDQNYGRCAAVVDLTAISHNVSLVKKIVGGADVMAVVKADGYGHGAAPTARAAVAAGAGFLGVATVEEGLELKREGINAPVLVLGPSFSGDMEEAIDADIRLTIHNQESGELISQAAKKLQKKAVVHIKVDTGMARLGFPYPAAREIVRVCHLPGLYPEGIFSHFAASDFEDLSFSCLQFNRFMDLTGTLENLGFCPHIKHMANSGGVLNIPESHLDLVRAGIILYGLPPSSSQAGARALRELGFRPVASIKSRVASIRTVNNGETVGYARNYIARGPRTIATIPMGYGDGCSRLLSNRGEVLIGGQRAPITGNICMDQFMVDITGIDHVKIGDEAILLGKMNHAEITAEELALLQGTINYEVMTSIGKRVPKIYI